MKKLIILCAAFFAIANAPAHAAEETPAKTAEAIFMGADGNEKGRATLTDTPGGILIHLDLEGLTPGEHAFHIHEKGACSPAGKFTDAGGHFNPGGHEHGIMAGGGAHAGDMPNVYIGEDGRLRADIVNDKVSLTGAHDRPALLDGDGAAMIIHTGADDYKSQPTGAAGDRAACAVIKGQ